MASSKLGTNAYISTVAAALTEIPAYVFVMLVMDRWGRKPLFSFAFFLTGVICIPAGFTSGNIQLTLALIGKECVINNRLGQAHKLHFSFIQ